MIRTKGATCSPKMTLTKRVKLAALEKHERKLEEIEQNAYEHKQDRGAFLINKASNFNHGYKLITPHVKKITLELFISLTEGKHLYKKDEKLRDLEILIANLFAIGCSVTFQDTVYRSIIAPVRISRNSSHYTKSRYTITLYYITDLIDMLEESGLIKQVKGVHFAGIMSMDSRIWPTKELLKMYQPFNRTSDMDFEYVELVILRDEKKMRIPYNDTPETRRIRRILFNAKVVNRCAIVGLKGCKRINTDLHAVFNNGNFNEGGRLYNGKNGYQSLSKSERMGIFINGEPTVELDYSGLHPRLLYARDGIKNTDEDLYSEIYPSRPKLRDILKLTMLVMINSRDDLQAVRSCNKTFNYEGYDTYRPLLEEAGLKITEVIERIKIVHKDISHHFCSVACYGLMNKDSKIALDIIEHFTSKGIPILAIHDSFIVTVQYKSELYDVMMNAYRKHSGGYDCPIPLS